MSDYENYAIAREGLEDAREAIAQLDPAADRLFITARARELADQMDRFNMPGSHPSNVELQSWAGAAAAVLRMVADRA